MLSKFSIKKPFTILVAVVIVIVFGVIALTKMTPDLFPKINTPYVIVMTTYPGASPEEAESEIFYDPAGVFGQCQHGFCVGGYS